MASVASVQPADSHSAARSRPQSGSDPFSQLLDSVEAQTSDHPLQTSGLDSLASAPTSATAAIRPLGSDGPDQGSASDGTPPGGQQLRAADELVNESAPATLTEIDATQPGEGEARDQLVTPVAADGNILPAHVTATHALVQPSSSETVNLARADSSAVSGNEDSEQPDQQGQARNVGSPVSGEGQGAAVLSQMGQPQTASADAPPASTAMPAPNANRPAAASASANHTPGMPKPDAIWAPELSAEQAMVSGGRTISLTTASSDPESYLQDEGATNALRSAPKATAVQAAGAKPVPPSETSFARQLVSPPAVYSAIAEPAPAFATAMNPANLHAAKPGEPNPVPLTGTALAMAIVSRAREGIRQFDIRLDPPELGRVDVRLEVDRNGQATTRLTVDRPETLELLQREARGLERALQQAGLKTDEGGLEFSLRQHGYDSWKDEYGEYAPEPPPGLLVVDETDSLAAGIEQYGLAAQVRGGVDIRI